MSMGRGAASLGIGFLMGTFVSAFVAMVAETVGTSIPGGWLAIILVGVMAGSVLPVHHLLWTRASGREGAEANEEIVTAGPPRQDAQG
jgi:drug/metabolite transporter (DMT)-like permease